jgi:hypothetical protein
VLLHYNLFSGRSGAVWLALQEKSTMASPATGIEGGTIVSVNGFARNQIIDGFGTSLMGMEGQQQWWQELYFDDLRASILRVDLTPRFAEPFSSFASPGCGSSPRTAKACGRRAAWPRATMP